MSGGITIHEMESVARGMGPGADLGTELSDPNDTFGVNMIANSGRNMSSGQSKQFSFNPTAPPSGVSGGGGLSEIEIGSVEPMQPITLDLGLGGSSMSGLSGPSAPIEIQFSKDTSPSFTGGPVGGLFSNNQSSTLSSSSLAPAPAPRLTAEEEKAEKSDLINKLQRLESKGIAVSRRFTMDNTLEEIKQEYSRLVDSRNLEASLRFQRQALMSVVTGMEWLNGRFDPFDIKLDGWSESVHENVEDFDEIFEELYDKYKERGKMPPEARLVMALAGSGFMCHVSNTFLRSRMPSMDDVLRNNPDMARQFAAAAAKQAGPGFGNFMSMAMGGSQAQGVQPAPVDTKNPGAFFGSNGSNAPPMAQVPQAVASMEPPRPTARREMKGPTGVDDILKTFQEVRRNEILEGNQQGSPDQMSQPALNAAVELQSMASDDIGSMTESVRGRRRRKVVPLGNTMEMDV
uniref:Uncharacterized protein n=1 Tax=viral metagenome TaxID=1070528 RepID=A0A6C0JUK1_9ZZZZ